MYANNEAWFKFLLCNLQMYVKNQARFERNLKSFMNTHSLTLSRAPCWKDVPVSFFQFFVTVHEHGGYNKVF